MCGMPSDLLEHMEAGIQPHPVRERYYFHVRPGQAFNLVIDIIDRVPNLRVTAAHLKEEMRDAIVDNMAYAHEHGTDRPELADWVWPY